ncbi:hypothetical protein C3Y87_07025 [Carbonactinospora thermoautotrophica]|uniref:hypothetical protein n=1 Tax=Carbonactinospora thermoautotrophica TaxID=1469144 RepID=UPI00226DF21D|nr:hypothetical protein [Carbonactinospora thermoautotrophica]MCX9191165.1 hypothetical protein [Carbonactinospora thermoautotrophica]
MRSTAATRACGALTLVSLAALLLTPAFLYRDEPWGPAVLTTTGLFLGSLALWALVSAASGGAGATAPGAGPRPAARAAAVPVLPTEWPSAYPWWWPRAVAGGLAFLALGLCIALLGKTDNAEAAATQRIRDLGGVERQVPIVEVERAELRREGRNTSRHWQADLVLELRDAQGNPHRTLVRDARLPQRHKPEPGGSMRVLYAPAAIEAGVLADETRVPNRRLHLLLASPALVLAVVPLLLPFFARQRFVRAVRRGTAVTRRGCVQGIEQGGLRFVDAQGERWLLRPASRAHLDRLAADLDAVPATLVWVPGRAREQDTRVAALLTDRDEVVWLRVAGQARDLRPPAAMPPAYQLLDSHRVRLLPRYRAWDARLIPRLGLVFPVWTLAQLGFGVTVTAPNPQALARGFLFVPLALTAAALCFRSWDFWTNRYPKRHPADAPGVPSRG